ncbi:hypothetical protein [Glycomyces xiaoerkulensis]|uniref:hypothetical protein n=1 Tax=Glycomyces xiaoerkulensis TaxID=2038139 RepID=UPI0012FFFB16|nr:hypothetical protein [Glycomyces xiaoerkulensis]
MTNPPQADQRKPRPGTVTLAVWLQLLLAVGMAVSTITGFVYGADADQALVDELERQGTDVGELPEEYGVTEQTFEPAGADLILPLVIVAGLVLLALFNLAGNRVTRILTWVFQPLVLICGGFVLALQVFLANFMQMGFDAADPPIDLDAQALVDAAMDAYPAWATWVDYAVFALATLGSLLVIILLAVPASNAYFRKEEAPPDIPGAPPQ